VSTDLVALYKALGGGWGEQPDVAGAKPPPQADAAQAALVPR
jgi:hypothetical protein